MSPELINTLGTIVGVLVAAFGAFLFAFWIAMGIWTFHDIRQRTRDWLVIVLAVALVLGLLVLPLLIYLAGRLTLGSYANGGPLALLGDYLRGLANGHLSVWIAVLGPYGFILLGRLFAAIWRRSH